MLARIRKAQEEREGGFTLIELLVVMIIIGILAAIAIPVFLNQRKKAVDTAAKSDISTLGKEIATYYVDATNILPAGVGTVSTGVFADNTGTDHYFVNGSDVGKISNGMSAATLVYTPNVPAGITDVNTATDNWCVQLTVTGGTLSNVSYSSANGLQLKACA